MSQTKEEWVEKNQDELLHAYYTYPRTVADCFAEMDKAFKTFERSLVEMGILEEDEEEDEAEDEEEDEDDDRNSAEHWDEWAADQRFDEYRDRALMGYEY